ncbi:MAG TPA: AAA family ATPase, partial [Pirellulales bacterium]|nr:AAA family ATPase [Pirellulales bacterium]
VESLVLKRLWVSGTCSGRAISEHICLPYRIIETLCAMLRTRQVVVHAGVAPFNDYYYSLTEAGREQAQAAMAACAYIGPSPVPLSDYVIAVEAQSILAEATRREQLEAAVSGISVPTELFDSLGPALNSGAGMFLYGAPGNGKSTLARRMTMCFGQKIWIPHAIYEDGQIINVFDSACHQPADSKHKSVMKASNHDRRWIRICRPTVVVGGELTMDNLEIRHDGRSNTNEAPMQLKSNCGCLLIDDFGRQRIPPRELLNRWIVPLEARHDFLTLPTGKKIQVPFEQLVIFSTNIEPRELVDEAFLRRIPYKIEIGDPDESEFHLLFQINARSFGCEYRREVVDELIQRQYRERGRRMRRCHPRDLLVQVRNYCNYNRLPIEMRFEYLDRSCKTYFTELLGDK